MSGILLKILISAIFLSSRNVISTATTAVVNNLYSTDIVAALKVLEDASVSISNSQKSNEPLPYATISYAQTLDGSM